MTQKGTIIGFALLLASFFCFPAQAQHRSKFLHPDTTLNKPKFYLLTGSAFVIYGSALVILNEYWYKNYDRSAFHFFDDGGEWLGMDKVGHTFNSYYQSRWGVQMYRWTGLKDKQAIWVGGLAGTFLQSSIEVLDGFSTKWGFSGYDFLANMGGSALVISQELAWHEQRIMLKASSWPQEHPARVRARAENLFGTTAAEEVVKDYNGLTIWASVNMASFMKKDSWMPEWLNVAVGYGANGMYGGFENKWCMAPYEKSYGDCDPASRVDHSDIPRYPQFYLSFDVDLTKIDTKSPILNSALQVLNIIKIPAPTLEFNPEDNFRFHPIFF